MTLQLSSVLPLVMAAVCASVAAFEFFTWARIKGSLYHFAFAIICVAAAAYDLACAGEYNVASPAASVIWLKIQAVTFEMTILAFFWYIAGITHMVHRGALFAAVGVFAIFVLFEAFAPGNLVWDISRPSVLHVHLPIGNVVYNQVEEGPLTDVQYFAGTALFVYIVVLIIRYYRAGHRRESVPLLLMCCVVFLAALNDLAVSEGVYPFVFTVEYGWLAAVIFVGLQRSRQLMEAAEARRALVESERRYRGIFESLQDVYFRADSEGIIRLISPSVRSFGYDPAFLVGRPVSALSPDEQAEAGIAAALGEGGLSRTSSFP